MCGIIAGLSATLNNLNASRSGRLAESTGAVKRNERSAKMWSRTCHWMSCLSKGSASNFLMACRSFVVSRFAMEERARCETDPVGLFVRAL